MTAAQKARKALIVLGTRRGRLNKETESLRRATRTGLRRAKKHGIPMEEAASLAGLSRSTAYEVYLNQEAEREDADASGGVNGRGDNGGHPPTRVGPRTKPATADGRARKGKRHPVAAGQVQAADEGARRKGSGGTRQARRRQAPN